MDIYNTVKLGNNEQLGTDHINLFVITGVRYNQVDVCTKWSLGTGNSVRYNRVSLYVDKILSSKDVAPLEKKLGNPDLFLELFNTYMRRDLEGAFQVNLGTLSIVQKKKIC